jgi:DNA gyrase/topoisomerase IV subunit A
MDKILPKLYKDYGEYSNYRNFPLDLDGLKPVERRVLLSAYTIARKKLLKSRQVDTYTMGHYHPHGECYGTIVQMVRQGFLIGQGNFGTNVGVEPVGPAAPRYTECKMNQDTIDLAFEYIKYVDHVDTEMGDKEPFCLPTKFPLCLLGNEYTQGIGFGYRTYIPCYTMNDLTQRLLWLLGIRKRQPIIAPISDCTIKSTKAELEGLLVTGQARISVEGIIIEDPLRSKVTLKSWPPGKRFESFLNQFQKEMDAGLIGFTDSSVTETEIVFQVLRERNRDKIFKDFVVKIKKLLTGYIPFEMRVVTSDQKVILKSVDMMLIDTYNMYKDVNERMLKEEVKRVEDEIEWLNTLEIIRPPLSHCLKSQWDFETSVDYIEQNSVPSIDKKIIEEMLSKYRIRKLLTLDTDTNKLTEEKTSLEENLNDLKSFVLKQYGV